MYWLIWRKCFFKLQNIDFSYLFGSLDFCRNVWTKGRSFPLSLRIHQKKLFEKSVLNILNRSRWVLTIFASQCSLPGSLSKTRPLSQPKQRLQSSCRDFSFVNCCYVSQTTHIRIGLSARLTCPPHRPPTLPPPSFATEEVDSRRLLLLCAVMIRGNQGQLHPRFLEEVKKAEEYCNMVSRIIKLSRHFKT